MEKRPNKPLDQVHDTLWLKYHCCGTGTTRSARRKSTSAESPVPRSGV